MICHSRVSCRRRAPWLSQLALSTPDVGVRALAAVGRVAGWCATCPAAEVIGYGPTGVRFPEGAEGIERPLRFPARTS